jgi:DNA-binding CsgD family transcriptional regulator
MDELRERPRGSPEQRTWFLRALLELVGAQVGIWADVSGMRKGAPVLHDALDFGWSSERERAVFLGYMGGQSALPDPSLPRLSSIDDVAFARRRTELLDDRTWYRSPHVQEQRRLAGVNHFVLAAWQRGERAQAMSLHRPWGDRDFSDHDRLLVETIYRVAAPLLAAPAGFSPRQRAVLDGLCRGLSEKQIADELKLSPHTVHDYVKELHRRLGARNRGELLAKALRG